MPVDADLLRATMRRVASPVTVITTGGPAPRGITIGSFTSLSLDPPLISFNVQRAIPMHAVLAGASHFVVHVLTSSQAHLSDHFAVPDQSSESQFQGLAYRLNPHSVPILEDALCVLECRLDQMIPAGDHSIVLGLVEAVGSAPEGSPLLYYDRDYRAVGASVSVFETNRSSRVSP